MTTIQILNGGSCGSGSPDTSTWPAAIAAIELKLAQHFYPDAPVSAFTTTTTIDTSVPGFTSMLWSTTMTTP
jgi:hypothetical protein